MTNHLMIQRSLPMRFAQILGIFLILIEFYSCQDVSSCLPCASQSCYQCFNTLPMDRTNVETLSILCNTSYNPFHQSDRYYSIVQSFAMINCPMKTLYLDQYSLWNYLEDMTINNANLTNLSFVKYNHSLSLASPILYSIKSLNLSYNSLQIIHRNFSFYFPSLQKLDLSYNQLILIRKKTFQNLLYLKELYLNNNYLKHLSMTIFPDQSLNMLNLNMNYWDCTCTNVHLLSISRPIPNCYTPNEFHNQNVSNIAQQCLLRKNTNLLITTNLHKRYNLSCVVSSILYEWENKINRNLTMLSGWDIVRHQSVRPEHLVSLNNQSNKYLVCFNLQSTHTESIYTIIDLPSIAYSSSLFSLRNLTRFIRKNATIISNTTSSTRLSPLFLGILNFSKRILPAYFQQSEKLVLLAWLILVIIALLIFFYLIYFIRCQKTSRSLIHFGSRSSAQDERKLLDVELVAREDKCLCEYRRRAYSTCFLTEATSFDILQTTQRHSIQPLYIEANQLRYAKIKHIPLTKRLDNRYSMGDFRTLVKFKPIPN